MRQSPLTPRRRLQRERTTTAFQHFFLLPPFLRGSELSSLALVSIQYAHNNHTSPSSPFTGGSEHHPSLSLLLLGSGLAHRPTTRPPIETSTLQHLHISQQHRDKRQTVYRFNIDKRAFYVSRPTFPGVFVYYYSCFLSSPGPWHDSSSDFLERAELARMQIE